MGDWQSSWQSSSPAMTLADILDGARDLTIAGVPARRPHIDFVGPRLARAMEWFHERVLPRLRRGEYVPHDEQHPPITAARLRERIAGSGRRGDGK